MLALETARLNFRQWRSGDFHCFSQFFSDHNNAEFVGGTKSAEESWRLMASYIGHYELNGYSYLAVEEKRSGKLVGTVGLWNSAPWPEIELGYWVFPEMQGKGFASEAGSAVANHAFKQLKLETFVSYVDERNKPSIKLAERLGAFRDGGMELLGFGYHAVYRYRDGKSGQLLPSEAG